MRENKKRRRAVLYFAKVDSHFSAFEKSTLTRTLRSESALYCLKINKSAIFIGNDFDSFESAKGTKDFTKILFTHTTIEVSNPSYQTQNITIKSIKKFSLMFEKKEKNK
jgi:hypothetical protein